MLYGLLPFALHSILAKDVKRIPYERAVELFTLAPIIAAPFVQILFSRLLKRPKTRLGPKAQNGIERDEDLEKALNQEGMTLEGWKAELENQLLYRQVVGREVYQRVEIAEEDLRRLTLPRSASSRVSGHLPVRTRARCR